jgi:tRNA nucleotidyltransferase (CCA-adding enzyme)
MQVYLVGGAVRDELLDRAFRERDWVVVGAVPAELERLGYRAVGREFPVYLHPETQEEYALARVERKVAPGYRGFVTEHSPAVTLEEDLLRRDLTINAMARGADGRIIDPYGGRADLQARVLRHVSPAFSEDPVRILRVARFAARFADLGFTVAPETMALMRTMVANGETNALVSERVWRELEGALGTASAQRCFEVLRDCGALPVLLPEFARSSDAPLAMKALQAAAAAGSANPIRWASLLAGLRVADVESLCARLRVPNEHRELAVLAARLAEDQTRSPERAVADPQLLVSLFEQADAFRRPERFAQWLEVLAARRSAAGLPAGESAALLARLRSALEAAAAVQLTAAELREHHGPQIGVLLRERRVAALRMPGTQGPARDR